MKTKKPFLLGDEPVLSKKKHSKLHDFAGNRKKIPFEENGIVTDKVGSLIKIGSFVEFVSSNSSDLLEGEVIEIHANNMLTVLRENFDSNEVFTHTLNSWDVKVTSF